MGAVTGLPDDERDDARGLSVQLVGTNTGDSSAREGGAVRSRGIPQRTSQTGRRRLSRLALTTIRVVGPSSSFGGLPLPLTGGRRPVVREASSPDETKPADRNNCFGEQGLA